MRFPRVHFSLRWIMIAVAFTAVLIWLARITVQYLATSLDTYYPEEKRVTNSWDAGPYPKVKVDLFAGYINVVQSTDGQVSAVITTSTVFKNSEAGAEAAVNGIIVTAVREHDTISIRATNPLNTQAVSLRTDVELRVPPEASLDVVTRHGYVHVGQYLGGPNGNRWMSAPVALKCVKASDLGDMFTGMEAEILSNPALPSTIVDLESRCGSIRIRGDNLLVRAKAHGGGIEYTGRLAPGRSSFMTGPFAPHSDGNWRLERGIRLLVPTDLEFEVDVIPGTGPLRCEFPLTFTTRGTASVETGATGVHPKVQVELKSEDEPVEVLQDKSGETGLRLILGETRTRLIL